MSTFLKSVDKIETFNATSTSLTLFVTVFGLLSIPVSSGVACGLSASNKVILSDSKRNVLKF